MERIFSEALKNRRAYYSITDQSPIPGREIKCIINLVVRHVPLVFSSQSTRVVLLLDKSHKKLWNIVEDTLRRIMPGEAPAKTEEKIDNPFVCGYGTVLFFEGQKVVKGLQEAFPLYQENFPGWSLQTSAIHQLAVWVMLEDVDFGASLQHYSPLTDDEVRRTWNLPTHWHLITEMPFGMPVNKPGEREFQPLEERIKVFK